MKTYLCIITCLTALLLAPLAALIILQPLENCGPMTSKEWNGRIKWKRKEQP